MTSQVLSTGQEGISIFTHLSPIRLIFMNTWFAKKKAFVEDEGVGGDGGGGEGAVSAEKRILRHS